MKPRSTGHLYVKRPLFKLVYFRFGSSYHLNFLYNGRPKQ